MATQSHRSSRIRLVATGLLAGSTLLAASVDTAMARRGVVISKSLAVFATTPLGLQGSVGAGERLVLPFSLVNKRSRRADIQVEYGIDLDDDGEISDGSDSAKPSEFVRATQSLRDSRDTARVREVGDRRTVTYRPSVDGASHAFVWDHVEDLGVTRILAGAQILRSEQGRALTDPFDRTALQFGADLSGVVLRVRARTRGGKRKFSDWAYTEGFSLDNSSTPAMSIDDVPVVDVAAGLIEIDWTAFDDDSEDLNGNGMLDLLGLEDRDRDGQLDSAPVAVHFDFYRLADGERSPTSPIALAQLTWRPCTRAAGQGDPDDGVASAPHGVGRSATFVWGYEVDLGGVGFAEGEYLLRGTPYDELGVLGDPVYYAGSVTIGTDE